MKNSILKTVIVGRYQNCSLIFDVLNCSSEMVDIVAVIILGEHDLEDPVLESMTPILRFQEMREDTWQDYLRELDTDLYIIDHAASDEVVENVKACVGSSEASEWIDEYDCCRRFLPEVSQLFQLGIKYADRHFRLKKNYITLGKFTFIDETAKIYSVMQNYTDHVTIGKFCSFAPNVLIMPRQEHHYEWATTCVFGYDCPKYFTGNEMFSRGDITIGNDVWIGDGAKIMSGVTIGDGAVVGACALVTKDVAPYEIVGGVPAKHIKWRFSDAEIKMLQEMKWWDWNLLQLHKAMPLLLQPDISKLYDYFKEAIL